MDVDRELLAKRELDDRLLLPAPEEGEDATQNRDRERRGCPHRASDSARVQRCEGSLNLVWQPVYSGWTRASSDGKNASKINTDEY